MSGDASDKKKKLEALAKQLGLKTGAEWAQERKVPLPKPPGEAVQDNSAQTQPPESPGNVRPVAERLGLMTGADWKRQREAIEEQRGAGAFEIDKVVAGELVGEAENQFYLARQDFPLEYVQGILPLGAALASSPEHIAFSARDPELEDFNPRTTLFMDTETTGLAGGAGTVAFLVGVGYFTEGCFRLDQCFMRDFDDEEAMLRFLAQRFTACETVVGYNSKSFDLPLLSARFVQNRIPFRLGTTPHYDLVHVARRFWKRRLADCTLGNVEREVLGVRRHGDVPSHLIPEMWFEYLHSRDARPLERVFYHHKMDILSLVTLTAWLSRCLDTPDGRGFEHTEDRLSVVRLHFQQKHYEDVLRHAKAFLEMDERSPLRRECLAMLGLACKRRERWAEMQEAWELLLEEFPGDLTALHELAKHHEHRTRNLPRAEALCVQALEGLNVHQALSRALLPALSPEARAFQHRLERIRRKLSKARGASDIDSNGTPLE